MNTRRFLPIRDTFSNLVLSSNSNIMVIIKTWLTEDIRDTAVLADRLTGISCSFKGSQRHAEDEGGGGIAVHQQLSCSVAKNITSGREVLWLIIHVSPHTIILGVCYRPPNNIPDVTFKLNNLSDLSRKRPQASFSQIDWSKDYGQWACQRISASI